LTGQGCIVENAVFNSVETSFSSSAKFSNVESDLGFRVLAGSPVIENSFFNVSDGLNLFGGSPTISGNVFVGTAWTTGIYCFESSGTISGNSISHFGIGINVYSGHWLISNNQITECMDGITVNDYENVTIRKNLICNNTQSGINGGNVYIDSNSIVNNKIGIHNPADGTVIRGNNIIGNTVNSVTATTPNVDATLNWWGTTDLAAINQTIYDYYDDSNWGKVTFTPILNSSNPAAPEIPWHYEPITTEPPPTEPTSPPASTTQPTPDYTPMPTIDHNIVKNNDNQDRSLLNLDLLVVVVAVPLVAVWVVVLLGYRLKTKISEFRQS
jgi:hypothetical protein